MANAALADPVNAMVVLGRISAPFGVEGWLKVHVFGDDPAAWRTMPLWWLGLDPQAQSQQAWQPYRFKSLRIQGAGLLVQLDEIADRTRAQAVQGYFVGAPRSALPELEQGTFYWGDLMGLDVVNSSGLSLGRVVDLWASSAHPVLVVEAPAPAGSGKSGNVQRLLPFTAPIVQEVRADSRLIQVNWEADW